MTTTRIVLLATLLNLLIVAGGVGAAYWLLRPAPVPETAAAAAAQAEVAPVAYEFFPVNKVIVSLRGPGREHYFLLDLMLQAEVGEEPAPKNFEQVEPLVRNSVVTYLSGLPFEELRGLPIAELQTRLEQVLLADFASQKATVPFSNVLVSKLIVQ